MKTQIITIAIAAALSANAAAEDQQAMLDAQMIFEDEAIETIGDGCAWKPPTAPLDSAQAKSPIKVDKKEAKRVQVYLKVHRFEPGPLDGKLGKSTVDAIKRWQARVGVAETGLVTEGLLQSAKDDQQVYNLWGPF